MRDAITAAWHLPARRPSFRGGTTGDMVGVEPDRGEAGRSPALTRNRRSRRVSTSRSTSVRLTFGSCPSRSAEGARSAGGVPPAVREPAVAAARNALALSSSPLPRGGLAVAVLGDCTDLGGEVRTGCATGDPASGREALEQAGFTPTDSIPGMICAIDSLPDPCPEEFDGSYWSYWTGSEGEWTAHVAGADTVDPAPGDVEGWRYNDGSTGPGLTPAEAAAAVGTRPADDGAEGPAATTDTPEPVDAAGESVDDAAEPVDDAADTSDDGGGVPTWVWFGAAGVVLIALGVVRLVRNRQA